MKQKVKKKIKTLSFELKKIIQSGQDLSTALKIADEIQVLDPNLENKYANHLWFDRFLIYQQLNDIPNQENALKQELQQFPTHYLSLFHLSNLYINIQKYSLAIPILEKIIDSKKKLDSNLSIFLAICYEKEGYFVKAIQIYSLFLTNIYDQIKYYFKESYNDIHKYNLLKSAKKNLLKTQQRITQFFQLLGKLLDLDEYQDKIDEIFELIINFQNIFQEILSLNLYVENISFFKTFFNPFPLPILSYSDLLFKTGEILEKQNKLTKAIELYDLTMKIDTDKQIKVLEKKGLIQDKCGNTELAKEIFKLILKIDPLNELAKLKLNSYK